MIHSSMDADTINRAFIAKFSRAMDFCPEKCMPQQEDGSFYVNGQMLQSSDGYFNPQSADSMTSLASEQGVPDYYCEGLSSSRSSGGGLVLQEQTPSNVPCFLQLLEDGGADVDSEKVADFDGGVFTDLSTGSRTPLHGGLASLINPRQQSRTPPHPAGSCSFTDDQIPVPCFNKPGFQPCTNIDELDMVMESIQGFVKQERPPSAPPVSAPAACVPAMTSPPLAAASVTRGCKRRRTDGDDYNTMPPTPGWSEGETEVTTPADEIRKERRKASNRKAAKKCREKKMNEQNVAIQAKEICMGEMEAQRQEIACLKRIIAQCATCRRFPPAPPARPQRHADEPS